MPDEVIRMLNSIAAQEGFKRKPDHKAGEYDDGPETNSDSDDGDEVSGDDSDDLPAPAATFMEIDDRTDAPGVVANSLQSNIAEYLSEAAVNSQPGVNEHPSAPNLVQEPVVSDSSIVSEHYVSESQRERQRGHKMPERYRAEVFHTHKESDRRHMRSMDLALLADWGDENWEQAFVISVRKAMTERPEEAEPVIRAELQQMVDKRVWHAVHANDLPPEQRRKIIRSSMFLKDKYLASGEFDKFKARLVAGGNMQDKTLYHDKVDLSSPTAATSSVFVVAAIAAHENRRARVIDIGGAFLLADIKSTGILVHVRLNKIMAAILIKIDPSYESFLEANGTLVVELDKALYGCVEAAALWHRDLCRTLLEFGYIANPYDVCVFNKVDETGVQSTIVLHVDDLLVTCVDDHIIDQLEACLRRAYPEITVRGGDVIGYLGMSFDFRVAGEVKVTMENSVAEILEGCGVTTGRKTPATECLFDVREESPVSSEERRRWFHSNVAKMLYLSKRVRPECLTAVAFLSKRVLCCTVDDEAKLARLLGYLLNTRGRGLVLRIGDHMSVSAYIDAAYGVHSNGKSHTGSSIVLGEAALICAKSGGQNIVTKSSTEAELVAVTDSAAQAIFVRNFVMAQGYEVGLCVIYQDNMSCMALIKRGSPGSERSRHINIRHFWVSDRVADKEVIVRHLSTKKMFANVLTKPLQGTQFCAERNELTNWY
jgi:hypothetical protein